MSDNTVYAIWTVCIAAIVIARMYFKHKGGRL